MFEVFLAAVQIEIDEAEPEGVHYCPLQVARTGTTDASLESQEYRTQLLKAIRKKNADEVLALIVRGNKENAKTLRTLNAEFETVALRQKRRRDHICQEDCLFSCIKKILKRICACRNNSFCKVVRYCWGRCMQWCKDEQQPTEEQMEEEKQWIEILSNPLYISLEWFCRIYSKSSRKESTEGRRSTTEASISVVIEGEENDDENQDVIATALRDSHLLEMIAGNDLHRHKDEYKKRANEVEKFAVAIVEGSTREQLIEVMDTKGDGCLKKEKSWNFSQSLSLLKIAADEKRKKVGGFLFVKAPCGNRAQS